MDGAVTTFRNAAVQLSHKISGSPIPQARTAYKPEDQVVEWGVMSMKGQRGKKKGVDLFEVGTDCHKEQCQKLCN